MVYFEIVLMCGGLPGVFAPQQLLSDIGQWIAKRFRSDELHKYVLVTSVPPRMRHDLLSESTLEDAGLIGSMNLHLQPIDSQGCRGAGNMVTSELAQLQEKEKAKEIERRRAAAEQAKTKKREAAEAKQKIVQQIASDRAELVGSRNTGV